jgi:predicted HTH transcriptional regulator
MKIATLIASHEGKTLEFKRDLSGRRNVLRTLCAFANTAGGTLVFGVEDSGAVTGVGDALAFEQQLANVVSDGIAPRIVPEIDIVSWRGMQLVTARVFPGPSRPYHLAALGPESGAYVRIGSTNRVADAELREELGRVVRGESYDELALSDLDVGAVDMASVAAAFASVRRIGSKEAQSLGIITFSGGRLVPTVGGALLFGANRLATFPEAWLQAGRFRGVTRTHIADSTDIVASMPDTVDRALAFVKRSMSLEMRIDGARRSEQWQFPLVAVREALINSVVHADYSQKGAPLRVAVYDDRLEIENPGMLVPGLTVDDVLSGVSRLRNRVIGRVFRELGLIEQWGSGVGRMIEACRDAGLPDPLLEEVGGRFRVTIFSRQTASPRLDDTNEAIVTALDRAPDGLSTAQVAETIDRSARTARTRLKELATLGLVVELGTSPNDPQRRYVLAEDRANYGR